MNRARTDVRRSSDISDESEGNAAEARHLGMLLPARVRTSRYRG